MEQEQIIAIYDDSVGLGDTIEVAYENLCIIQRGIFEISDVSFFRAREIKVKMQLIEINGTD